MFFYLSIISISPESIEVTIWHYLKDVHSIDNTESEEEAKRLELIPLSATFQVQNQIPSFLDPNSGDVGSTPLGSIIQYYV